MLYVQESSEDLKKGKKEKKEERKVSRLPLGTKEAVGVNCDVEMYPFKSNKHLYFLNFKWNK